MSFKKIVIAGGGVLGGQIAYQISFKGFDTTIWLRSEGSIERMQPKLQLNHDNYINALEQAKTLLGSPLFLHVYPAGLIDDPTTVTVEEIEELEKQADKALADLKIETDMAKAFEGADLIIESIVEDPKQKVEFYKQAAPLLSENTILCTNSSTLLPSMFAEYTGRPEKYLAFHFANEIFKHNTAEIMGHPGTEQQYYDAVVEFAKAIGMLPLQLHKEQSGYILNSMLVPFLLSAQALWARGVADPETIDLTWKKATGSPVGPFHILDVVGLKTAYDICRMNPQAQDPESDTYKIVQMLKEKMDKGEGGMSFGKGFYDYTKK